MPLLNHRVALFSITLAILALVAYRFYDRYFSGTAEIVFLDMAQGESILLKLPYGKAFLIDGGSSTHPYQAGEEIFRELSRRGILHLSGLILSHPDKDHGGAIPTLFRYFSIEKFLYAEALESHLKKNSNLLRELKAEAQSRKTPMVPIRKEVTFKSIGSELTHYSFVPLHKRTSNNLSVVSLLRVFGCRFLFTGDIEKETEKEILKTLHSSIDVLKVAHHGSVTSSSRGFVKALAPKYAVISVGAQNRYGHPRREVLERFRFFRSQILRTDFHGFVSFKISSKGEALCETALGPCGRFPCLN